MTWMPRKLPPLNLNKVNVQNKLIEVILSPPREEMDRIIGVESVEASVEASVESVLALRSRSKFSAVSVKPKRVSDKSLTDSASAQEQRDFKAYEEMLESRSKRSSIEEEPEPEPDRSPSESLKSDESVSSSEEESPEEDQEGTLFKKKKKRTTRKKRKAEKSKKDELVEETLEKKEIQKRISSKMLKSKRRPGSIISTTETPQTLEVEEQMLEKQGLSIKGSVESVGEMEEQIVEEQIVEEQVVKEQIDETVEEKEDQIVEEQAGKRKTSKKTLKSKKRDRSTTSTTASSQQLEVEEQILEEQPSRKSIKEIVEAVKEKEEQIVEEQEIVTLKESSKSTDIIGSEEVKPIEKKPARQMFKLPEGEVPDDVLLAPQILESLKKRKYAKKKSMFDDLKKGYQDLSTSIKQSSRTSLPKKEIDLTLKDSVMKAAAIWRQKASLKRSTLGDVISIKESKSEEITPEEIEIEGDTDQVEKTIDRIPSRKVEEVEVEADETEKTIERIPSIKVERSEVEADQIEQKLERSPSMIVEEVEVETDQIEKTTERIPSIRMEHEEVETDQKEKKLERIPSKGLEQVVETDQIRKKSERIPSKGTADVDFDEDQIKSQIEDESSTATEELHYERDEIESQIEDESSTGTKDLHDEMDTLELPTGTIKTSATKAQKGKEGPTTERRIPVALQVEKPGKSKSKLKAIDLKAKRDAKQELQHERHIPIQKPKVVTSSIRDSQISIPREESVTRAKLGPKSIGLPSRSSLASLGTTDVSIQSIKARDSKVPIIDEDETRKLSITRLQMLESKSEEESTVTESFAPSTKDLTDRRVSSRDIFFHEKPIDQRTAIKNYMLAKGISELFQFMTTKLILDKPEEPLDYLIDLTSQIEERNAALYKRVNVKEVNPKCSKE